MSKNTLIVVIVAIMIGALAYQLSSNEAPSNSVEPLKIGYLPLADHMTIMTGAGGDLFEGVDVTPVKFSDWPSLVEALKSGAIDGAHVINTLAMKMAHGGFNGKIVALSHRGTIALATKPDITDIEQLKGAKIAVPTRFSPHYMMLHNYLTKHGFDVETDVSILDVAPPDFVSTLSSKGTDAFIGSEPFPTIAQTKNVGSILTLWDDMQIEGTNGLDCVVVFKDSVIEAQPDSVLAYVHNTLSIGQFIESNPQEAAEFASSMMLNLSPDLILKAINDPAHRSRYDDLVPVISEFEAFQDYMLKIGLLSNSIDLTSFVDTQFIK